MKKLWCLFRRRSANGADKLCVADSETQGRVCACKFATEEEAKAKCSRYAYNNRPEGEEEGIE